METFNDPGFAPTGKWFRSVERPWLLYCRTYEDPGHEYEHRIEGQSTVSPRYRTTYAVKPFAPFVMVED